MVKHDPLAAAFLCETARRHFPTAGCCCHRTAMEALRELRTQPARLAIVGQDLGDLDGLDLIDAMEEERLAWRVLVILDRTDEHTLARLRRGRIDGIFDPCAEPLARLGEAMQRVAAGGHFFSQVASPAGGCAAEPTLNQLLTPHELLVFAVIGDGCDNQAAAGHLGLAAETVHWHRQRIMRKLGVQSRGDLMRAALSRGVVRIVNGIVLRPGFERALAARLAASRAAAEAA